MTRRSALSGCAADRRANFDGARRSAKNPRTHAESIARGLLRLTIAAFGLVEPEMRRFNRMGQTRWSGSPHPDRVVDRTTPAEAIMKIERSITSHVPPVRPDAGTQVSDARLEPREADPRIMALANRVGRNPRFSYEAAAAAFDRALAASRC
jgi:hypothetical protein